MTIQEAQTPINEHLKAAEAKLEEALDLVCQAASTAILTRQSTYAKVLIEAAEAIGAARILAFQRQVSINTPKKV